MINLSNGHSFDYMTASGALGFDGRGWMWEWPLVKLGLIKPELFTVVIRTLTLKPRLWNTDPAANLSWIRPWTWLPWSPWSCVRFLPDGGAVNKVGLYNPGINWWCEDVAPNIDFEKVPLVASICGDGDELVIMADKLDSFPLKGIEVNYSCPNSGTGMDAVAAVVRGVKAVKAETTHPVIVKVSVNQDYLAIARGLEGVAEAISLNSVPWTTAFPGGEKTPLWRLEKRVKGGGGGVSGKPAQKANWAAVKALAEQGSLPVIGPGVMEYEDMGLVRDLGAQAVSFGAIHLRKPWLPTQFVERETLLRKGQGEV